MPNNNNTNNADTGRSGLTVGLIGVTHPHSAGYLRTLELVDRVAQVILCDRDAAATEQAIQTYRKAVTSYATIDALLERPDVPVVLIAQPNDLTPTTITRAAEAGKHVICEKPGARSAAELQPALEAIERNRVQFTMCYLWRRHPAILQMRELIRQGALGRLTSVELRMVTTKVGLRNPAHWLFQRAVAGGGILTWLACHWIDLMRFLTGQEVASVAALTGTLSGEAIDVEDIASVSMRLTGGALVSLYAGYLLSSGRPGYEGASYDQCLILRGTEGTISLDFAAGDPGVILESSAAAWTTAPRQTFRYTLPNLPAYGGAHGLKFIDDFLRAALSGDGASPAPAIEALRTLEILDAIHRSAETERVVHLARTPG